MRMATAGDLKPLPLFARLTADELEAVATIAIVKDYPTGMVLFYEGMPANVLHVVVKGRIEIFRQMPDGDVSLNELGPGDYLGEVSLADSQPRSASARTATDSLLLIITKDSFDRLVASNMGAANKLLLHFVKVLAQRLRRAEARLR